MIKKVFEFLFFMTILISVFSCKEKLSSEETLKLYLSAVDCYTNQEYDQALVYLNLIKQNDSDFYQADFLIGKVLFFKNDLINAEQLFLKLQKKYPEYIEARIWYIRTLIISRQFDKAESELEKQLSFNQTDWRLFYLYSLLEDIRGNMDKKIVMLKRAELAMSDSAKVYMELATVWNLLDVMDKSEDYLLKAKIISETNESLSALQKAINGEESK